QMLFPDAANAVVYIDDDDEEGADEGDKDDRKLGGRPEQDRQRHPCQRRNGSQQLDDGKYDLGKHLSGAEEQSQRNAQQLRGYEPIGDPLEAHDPGLPVLRTREIFVPEGAKDLGKRRYSFKSSSAEANQKLPQQDESSHRNRSTPIEA